MRFLLIVVAALLTLLSAASVALAETCLTASCHSEFQRVPFAHAPVSSDCTACHESVSAEHPLGEGDFRLVASGADLCYRCHDNMITEARYHEPVKLGRCTYCHDVHGGEHAFLLVKTVNQLCLNCHTSKRSLEGMDNLHPVLVEDGCTACHSPHTAKYKELLPVEGADFCGECHAEIRALTKAAKVKHGAMEDGCVACHDPHGTGYPRMFATPEKKFCVSCHEDIGEQIEVAKSQHKPVVEGTCSACHNPHGSDYYRILESYYPEPFYVGYSEEQYQLCFTCHDNRPFKYERTSAVTGFRNGDRNLHYLHVNKPVKGRVCKTCHGVHGADQKKLVMSKVPGFGRWQIPIYMQESEFGTTCTVGCHKPKTYHPFRRFSND